MAQASTATTLSVHRSIQLHPTSSSNQQQQSAASVHPNFRQKIVCSLTCRHCETMVCTRGMKAILLGDTRVCIVRFTWKGVAWLLMLQNAKSDYAGWTVFHWSSSYKVTMNSAKNFQVPGLTAVESFRVELVDKDYTTRNCRCKIRDVACLTWYAVDGCCWADLGLDSNSWSLHSGNVIGCEFIQQRTLQRIMF